ncbi:hypothetical protein [Ramlibacter alkalitolerans]|uniref:Uncharacterized protein n=1 Tax=Ramlibacter alkalitolerans TaxID=2039631 RepID=A0ABS1JTY7_9BURK|nr:hypothetical protein [Ramlibacter alkalitolerans]MBL0427713.1 hypothetical protein [Ramlibacter alkalitolerans]
MQSFLHRANPENARLCELLDAAADRKGHDERQQADALCVTLGFMRQVRQGMRKRSALSDAFIRGCAQYAGVSYEVARSA